MPGPFADAAYRGSLMHAAMQALFSKQTGNAGLPAAAGIEPAVSKALLRHQAEQRLLPVSLASERQRLISLLGEWLEFEQAREGFVVDRLEWGADFDLNRYGIRVRADRIDRMNDGRLLIIDYKSSPGTTSHWARQRIQQSQLPLYAVLLDQNGVGQISGIAFAAVRAGDCGFSGITDDPGAVSCGIRSFSDRHLKFEKNYGSWENLFSFSSS